jgi:hypothetical protein
MSACGRLGGAFPGKRCSGPEEENKRGVNIGAGSDSRPKKSWPSTTEPSIVISVAVAVDNLKGDEGICTLLSQMVSITV